MQRVPFDAPGPDGETSPEQLSAEIERTGFAVHDDADETRRRRGLRSGRHAAWRSVTAADASLETGSGLVDEEVAPRVLR